MCACECICIHSSNNSVFLTCPELLTSKFISTQSSLEVSYSADALNHYLTCISWDLQILPLKNAD